MQSLHVRKDLRATTMLALSGRHSFVVVGLRQAGCHAGTSEAKRHSLIMTSSQLDTG